MQETLRKYSVVPVVTRKAAVDDEICGYQIPKGAYIACHIGAVHAREWESPLEWRPHRFLPGQEFERFDDSLRAHKVSYGMQPPLMEPEFKVPGLIWFPLWI